MDHAKMRHLRIVAFALASMAAHSAASHAQDGDSMAGRAYAVQHCTECHDVGAGPKRALRRLDAPDFKAIAEAPTTTAMGLSVFLNTTHANMPNFMIPDEDRRNVISYILSLARKGKPGAL